MQDRMGIVTYVAMASITSGDDAAVKLRHSNFSYWVASHQMMAHL